MTPKTSARGQPRRRPGGAQRPRRPVGTPGPREGGALGAALAAIESGPAGSATAAILDFDGTLISGYSVLSFLSDRIRRQELDASAVLRWLSLAAGALGGASTQRELIEQGMAELAGRSVRELDATGERMFARDLAEQIFPEMRTLVEAHRRQGHTLLVATSAAGFQVMPAARELGIEHVLHTRLVAKRGRLTGSVAGGVLWGEAKAEAVRAFARSHGIALESSYFYADGDEDQALMHLVGHPRPTNPKPGLRRVAERRGWPVLQFDSRGRADLGPTLRSLTATALVAPIALGAAGVRLLTGNRREAANLLTATLMDYWVALGNVQLNVIGEEHLWSQRPAVFIFNHRNNFDAQIMGKLVRRDFGVVAKKELASNPIFALASRFLHIAFIDRDDPQQAVAALQPCSRLLQDGISMILAPEGRRIRGREVGEFKKGAFRLALDAGVPIVPVVFRNADQIGPSSSTVMRPCQVDIAVLAPVQVDDWTLANLDERIARVRQRFVDTLARWPGDAAG